MVLRVSTVCALLFLIAPASAAVAQVSPAAGRVVSGTVVDEHTKAAIGGVLVRLVALSADARRPEPRQGLPALGLETVSDAAGRFRFEGVAPARYRLVIELEGFTPFEFPRDILVAEDVDPPPVLISYVLRVSAEVRATAAAAPPADTAAGSAMNLLPGRAVVVAAGGLEDVMRVFQKRPGVAASQDDRNDLLVRGGGAIENATRVDGFDIANPAHFGAQGGSGGGFSFIAPWLIDRAALRAGGFSVQFGERASSVLDLTLKAGSKDRVRGQAGASAGGAMGQAEGPLNGGRGSWLVSARRSFLDLVLERGGDTAIPHYSDFVGRFEYSVSPAHRIEMLGVGAIDDVMVKSGDSTDSLQDNQTAALFGVSLHSQWNPTTASALYVSYGRSSIDAAVNGRSAADGVDQSTEIELRARGEMYRRVGRDGQAMVGVAVKRANLRFDLEAESFRTQYSYQVAALHSHFPYRFADLGTYAEVRLPTVRRLQVTPGLRFDRLGTTDRFYTSPRLNLEYRASQTVRLTAAWGVYRQGIPYIWIGSNVANASLDPIRSVQALAGISVNVSRNAELVVEGFDKRYDGYPIDPSEPWHVLVSAAADFESPFVGALDGGGRLRARGVDSMVTRRFGDRLTVNASYSLWRVGQAGLDAVWRRGDYDIRNQVRLDLAYEVAGRWRAGAEFRYASGRPYTPYDVRTSVRIGSGRYDRTQLNGSTYPSYHRLDVRCDRTFAIRRTSLIVYAEVDNLYNRDNVLVYEWNRATRQPRPVYQWGRLPVAGIRWEF